MVSTVFVEIYVYNTTFPIDETIHPIHPSFEADRAS